MKRQLNCLMMVVLVLALAGCANTVNHGAAILEVNKNMYDTSMSIAADMYEMGHIGDAEVAKVIEIGTWYMEVHNLAVGALLAYENDSTDENWIRYINALGDVGGRLEELYLLREALK